MYVHHAHDMRIHHADAAHLTAFSISQIAGAFCDDGQNYKNIVLGIKSMGVKYVEKNVAGCSKKN